MIRNLSELSGYLLDLMVEVKSNEMESYQGQGQVLKIRFSDNIWGPPSLTFH